MDNSGRDGGWIGHWINRGDLIWRHGIVPCWWVTLFSLINILVIFKKWKIVETTFLSSLILSFSHSNTLSLLLRHTHTHTSFSPLPLSTNPMVSPRILHIFISSSSGGNQSVQLPRGCLGVGTLDESSYSSDLRDFKLNSEEIVSELDSALQQLSDNRKTAARCTVTGRWTRRRPRLAHLLNRAR